MKNLECFEDIKQKMNQTDVKSILFTNELPLWEALTEEEIQKKLYRICTTPLCDCDFTIVYTLYARMKWVEVLKNISSNKGIKVLEIGSGSSTIIPEAMAAFDMESTYITANMNKKLTEGLREKTSSLPVQIEVIEDDAIHIKNYLASDSVDAIVFEHSVNDILQAILCENNGIDTTNKDWFEILPEMIKMISGEYVNQTLEQKVKSHFLSLVNNCLSVLKPGGYLAMSHYMFQYDLDLGYHAELWENMLPYVRPWFEGIGNIREVSIEGFDPQWWLFFQKI